jgi:RNA polymerase sigma factor (sigma-70 family)
MTEPEIEPETQPELDELEPTRRPDPGPEIEELLEQLRPRIKRLLRIYDIPWQDAEDLLQEALIAAFRKWDSIEHREAWFLGTIRNRCMLYWKRRWRNRMEGMDPGDLEAICEPLPPPQERETMLWDLAVIAETIGERHWAMLYLRYGLGLSIPEVAQRLGYCASSIRKLSCRTVAQLQRQMSAGFAPTTPPGKADTDQEAGPKPAYLSGKGFAAAKG